MAGGRGSSSEGREESVSVGDQESDRVADKRDGVRDKVFTLAIPRAG